MCSLLPATDQECQCRLAPDETVILRHPPLPLVGVSMVMEKGCQQNECYIPHSALTNMVPG